MANLKFYIYFILYTDFLEYASVCFLCLILK